LLLVSDRWKEASLLTFFRHKTNIPAFYEFHQRFINLILP